MAENRGFVAQEMPAYSEGKTENGSGNTSFTNPQFPGYGGNAYYGGSPQYAKPMDRSVPVVMTVLDVQQREPRTQIALVCSVLSSIFCLVTPFGPIALLIAWKARLHVLDRKWAHARHTLTVSWVFFGLSVFFGIGFWAAMTVLFVQMTRSSYYYQGNSNYQGDLDYDVPHPVH